MIKLLLLLLWLVPGLALAQDITTGLMARYEFATGTGTTAFDTSGNARNGTLGAAGAAPAWVTSVCVAGGLGGCMSFDGGDTISLPNVAGLNITGDITLATWVNVTDVSTFPTLIGGYSNSTFFGYALGVLDTGIVQFWNGTAWTRASGPSILDLAACRCQPHRDHGDLLH